MSRTSVLSLAARLHFAPLHAWALALPILVATPGFLSGQVPLSAGIYFENFDSLITSGSSEWLDERTLPGWYASRSVAPHAVTNYAAGNGSGTTGGLYSFGELRSTDRALGSLASGGPGRLAYGVRLLNDTDRAQTDFRISYVGEQWRAGGNGVQKLSFSYQVGNALTNADAAREQSWTPLPTLDFQGPNTNVAQALNGNDPADRVVFGGVLIPGVVLSPGRELFLRWEDVDDPGYDHALGLDDLVVSFHEADTNGFRPGEPAAFTLLTYNTHGNQVENWSTNSYQVRAIGRQLLYLKPDVITFNEIPDTNTYQMANWVKAYLPGYFLATNSESDGAIRNVIASRFPIIRSQSRLHGLDLGPFGCTNEVFKRDFFEAEIAVPDFPQPLHVFSLHLKSGQDTASAKQRAAEASAVSNFFATGYLSSNSLHPCVVSGDMNEDLVRPPASNPQTLQRLVSPATGLRLITPLNPISQSELTFSIQAESVTKRYDYILPCGLLSSNVSACSVFRSDLLTNPPYPLWTNDDRIASDHLPVIASFRNPYVNPFRVISVTRDDAGLCLDWESVPGEVYYVEAARDLNRWSAVSDEVVACGSTCMFRTNPAAGAQYFRIRRRP